MKTFLKLRGACVTANLTQLELAKALGISEVSLSRKLSGKTDFKLGEVVKIKDALGLNTEQFLNILVQSLFLWDR